MPALSVIDLSPNRDTVLSMDTLKAFSANLNIHPRSGAPAAITFPLVQGIGFVTGIYKGARPVFQSGVLFRSLSPRLPGPRSGMFKYRIVLEDGKTVKAPSLSSLRYIRS